MSEIKSREKQLLQSLKKALPRQEDSLLKVLSDLELLSDVTNNNRLYMQTGSTRLHLREFLQSLRKLGDEIREILGKEEEIEKEAEIAHA